MSLSPNQSTTAQKSSTTPPTEVVEIGLLLPQTWAAALVELSSRRNQSVAQLLRTLVDHELHGAASSC